MGMTQQEVADELGISRQSLQLIEKSAMEKFRRNFKELYGVPDLNKIRDELRINSKSPLAFLLRMDWSNNFVFCHDEGLGDAE